MSAPLIFTHYGNSEYLPFALRQAKRSNPNLPLYFIGDASNFHTTTSLGWKHVYLSDLRTPKRDEFNARFRWVQGKHHQPVKGGGDWLRYVFERFFILEGFLNDHNIQWFWHFDTDTMILHDLLPYEQAIKSLNLSCTTLCEDCCPSGLIRTSTVREFCSAIIESFKNEEFLSSQQKQFNEAEPQYAYTEMRAFWHFRESSGISTQHLASLFKSSRVWFDDCICQQTGGFAMVRAEKLARMIKDFRAAGTRIFCKKNGIDMEFATINCSWVSTDVFHWIEQSSSGNDTVPESLSEYVSNTITSE